MIFDTPAHFVTIDAQAPKGQFLVSDEGHLRKALPELVEWLDAEVGEEWVEWAYSADETWQQDLPQPITLAIRDETKALLTIMRWGKNKITVRPYLA